MSLLSAPADFIVHTSGGKIPWDRAAPRRFTYPLENLDSQAQNQINHFHTRRLDRLHPLDTDDAR
ncbi:MAG: hypothetical protein AB1813_14890 [Verrucomicrobiota bacterium]